MISHSTLDCGIELVTEQISNDGTRKWLLRAGPGIEFETVFIPEPGRGTLCVSSQVGCTLNCRFCHTGTQKLVRNLTPAEIVGQVMLARPRDGQTVASCPLQQLRPDAVVHEIAAHAAAQAPDRPSS